MMVELKRNAYAWRKKAFLFLATVLLFSLFGQLSSSPESSFCSSRTHGPTQNPITDSYSEYAWTDSLKWSCVYNINDFEGFSDQERFNNARDAAYEHGGGVVYLPTGTYRFTDDLILRNGVTVRGDAPRGVDAQSEGYMPPTRLVFPRYRPTFSGDGTPNDTAFKVIRSEIPETDSNLGLIYLDIDHARVELGDDAEIAQNHDIIIFGIRSNNAAQPHRTVPDIRFQSPWLRFSNLLSANVKITAYANVLVANNRLNDSITDDFQQPNYQIRGGDRRIITLKEGWKVPFSYANHYGISVNRFKNGSILFAPLADPSKEPQLFRQGIAIRDNWVYHTMSVAIHASGDGLLIKGNVIKDESEKRWYTDRFGLEEPYLNRPDKSPRSITYENRAIDWSGWNVSVEGNRYEVYRHYLSESSEQSVDGEGILAQECCGGTKIQGASIINNRGNSYIGLYKVPFIQNVYIFNNEVYSNVTKTSSIYVSADTNEKKHRMDNVRIENNFIEGDITALAGDGGIDNFIRDNITQNQGLLQASCHVVLENNRGFGMIPCRESLSASKQNK